MTSSGYSGTLLVRKLGLKEGSAIYVHQAPDGYLDWLFPLPDSLSFRHSFRGPLDFIHLFEFERAEFENHFRQAKKALSKAGLLWVSWPKKSSGVASDLDDNITRQFGLEQDLVDVKVCAVNETWSGLKFVFRKKDR